MEPHKPSMATGTIGTLARRAINSKPRRNGKTPPLRVRLPSGKMQTSSPSLRASADFWIASLAFSSATGMVRIRRVNLLKIGLRSKPSQERKRIGRGQSTPSTTTST